MKTHLIDLHGNNEGLPLNEDLVSGDFILV